MKGKFIKLISVMLVAAMTAMLFTSCSTQNNQDTAAKADSYILLSINPAVELITDENNIVTDVKCVNEDAEILLSETELEGMTIEEASETFVQLSAEAGYIDVDSVGNKINVGVINDDTTKAEGIYNRISQKTQAYLDENCINGITVRETYEELQTQADELGISVYQLRLILAVIENNPDEYTIETLLPLTTAQLRAILKVNFEELKDIATSIREEYHALKAQIRINYAAMFALGDEIDALRLSLSEFVGSDEERLALEETIAEKQAEYDAQFVAFKAEMTVAHENYKTESQAIKAQLKLTLTAKKQQFKNKIKQHFDNVSNAAQEAANQAAELGISVKNMTIINLLVELYPEEYTVDSLKNLTTAELTAIVQSNYDELKTQAANLKSSYDAEISIINNDAKYAEMFVKIDEIDVLEQELKLLNRELKWLRYFGGTSEEITSKQAEITAKEAKLSTKESEFEANYGELLSQYQAAITSANNEYKIKVEAIKDTLNKLFEAYKNQNNSNGNSINDIINNYKNQVENIINAEEQTSNIFGYGRKNN